MEIFKQTNFDFLGKKWPFIGLSLLLTLAGIVSLAIKGGPKYGIDFNGGALMDVNFIHRPSAEQIRSAVRQKISGEIEVQEVTSNPREVLISTGVRDERGLQVVRNDMLSALNTAFNPNTGGKLDINTIGQTALVDALRGALSKTGGLSDDAIGSLANRILEYRDTPPRSGLIGNLNELSGIPGMTPQILSAIRESFFPGQFHIGRVEIVGPKIGADLRQQAINVVLIALGAMLVYIAFRFEWIYGVAAVVAVFHDTIITIGLFSLFNKQIDLTVIAALLTLVGYSMNDTIVVFDRIRENLRLGMRGSFRDIVNTSINQTLSRTVLTSGLTFLTALSLYLFGGQVLNGFSFALVVGIIVGTYSSIFIASPILIFWHDLAEKRRRNARLTATPVENRARVSAGSVKGIKTAK
ncbi:MAG: protein translocase subunit SecF [Acidobacteriaceae bacterium]|nr:protein translocase subunit SecF [Acidobacteriaceae bacterium]MBV9036893.1 protein translocase subunit SecF [Acidobacteriaceae bacterium]MBV9224567.1 protein translocase subunit SecF [Acidobacteriaceae bacterium]MBV9677809.1 protein translocase subunit SecF [Acidobacteriaceae bacterium]MBV9938884.1 protein translocase subunit SecF [Acidobacteriaceae bacterium]